MNTIVSPLTTFKVFGYSILASFFLLAVTSCSGAEEMTASLPAGWRVIDLDEYIIAIPPTLKEYDQNQSFYKKNEEQTIAEEKVLRDFRVFIPVSWFDNRNDTLMCNVVFMLPAKVSAELSKEPYAYQKPDTRKYHIQHWRKFLLGGSDEQYMVGEPSFKAIRIYGGIRALVGKSRWNYPKQEIWGTQQGLSFLFFDKDRCAAVHIRYPENQDKYWEKDLDYMVHTFRWK